MRQITAVLKSVFHIETIKEYTSFKPQNIQQRRIYQICSAKTNKVKPYARELILGQRFIYINDTLVMIPDFQSIIIQ